MKRVTSVILLCLSLILAGNLCAEEVYSWTDQNGVLNITNRKPKNEVKVENVDRYKVPKREAVRPKPDVPDVVLKPKQAEIEQAENAARRAKEDAEAARAFAREAREALDEFREKVGYKKKRLRNNRARIEKMEQQAALAAQQAKAAEEVARSARAAAEALKQVQATGAPAENRK